MGYNPIVSIEGWIIKMIQLYNGILLINKKEQITTRVTIWMNMKNIVLGVKMETEMNA